MNTFADDILFINSGLNFDDDLRIMPKGDSRYRLDVIMTELGNMGVPTNMKNRTQKTAAPAGSKAIGFVYDKENNEGIYFMFNESTVTRSVTSVADYSGTVEGTVRITTSTNHNYTTGDYVTLVGLSNYSGTHRLTVINVTQYYISYTFNGTDTGTCRVDDHRILRYDPVAETFTTILAHSILQFQEDYPIKGDIVGDGVATQDGEGQLLYWTDGFNPPRKLNITKAINYSAGSGTPIYTDITEDILEAAKQPPLFLPPSDDYVSFYAQNNANPIVSIHYRRNYQLAFRYFFDDNEISVFSDWTPVVFKGNYWNEMPDGTESGWIHQHLATLRITVPSIPFENVTKVTIAARIIDQGAGVPSDWFELDTIDFADWDNSNVDFTETIKEIALSQTDFVRPFDYLPRLAGVQEVIDDDGDSRLAYGDITEGFDNPTPDITLTPVYEQDVDLYDKVWVSYDQQNSPTPVDLNMNIPSGHALGSRESHHAVKLGVTLFWDNIYHLYSDYTSPISQRSADSVSQALRDKINVDYPGAASSPGGGILRLDTTVLGNTTAQYYRDTVYIKHMTFKFGSKYILRLRYFDEQGRYGSDIEDADLEVSIPFYTDLQASYTNNDIYAGVQYQIKHRPPDWAHYYKFVFAGKNINSILQYGYIANATYVALDDDYLKIDLGQYIADADIRFQNNINISYTHTPGNRIRFIGYISLAPAVPNSDSLLLFDVNNFVDKVIDKYDSGVLYIKRFEEYSTIWNLAAGLTVLTPFVMFEIYSTQEIDNSEGYEIGDMLEIGNPGAEGRYHKACSDDKGFSSVSVQDQDPNNLVATPCVGVIEGFDTILNMLHGTGYFRLFVGTYYFSEVYFVREDTNISPLYDSEIPSDIGRIGIVDDNIKEKRLNALRNGGVYIDNTQINYINQFDSDAFADIDDKNGRIYSIHQQGNVLYVIQEKKVTSIDIGRTTMVLPDGSTQVTQSTRVFGSKRPKIEVAGTIHKNSVVVNDTGFYFYDYLNARVYRYSRNGLTPISSYKMEKYFKDKTKELVGLGLSNFEVSAGFDEENQLYFITFTDINTPANSETVAFHETSNRWFTFSSLNPELYGNIGDDNFIDFTDGNVYKRNDSSVPRLTMEITVVGNEAPGIKKTFNTIHIDSNSDDWVADQNDSIELPAERLPNGVFQTMVSKILNWRFEEGIYKASFLRDMKTSTGSPSNHDLHQGRQLRGEVIIVKLTNDDTGEVQLRKVTINSSASSGMAM